MNTTELKMIDVLKELSENYAVSGIKAEFEAEGTRTEELIRLKEICLKARASLTLKIGGCEAVRDMYDARIVGVDHLVAPMVETPFALRKYLKAIDIAFPEDEQQQVNFLINTETIQTARNFDQMLGISEIGKLNGIVVGRSDMVGSMGMTRDDIDGDAIFDVTKILLIKAKALKMTCVMGGTITANTIPFLKALPEGHLDRFETRKVCFNCKDALSVDTAAGINKALFFELLWLENKSNYYKAISEEDNKRITALQARFK